MNNKAHCFHLEEIQKCKIEEEGGGFLNWISWRFHHSRFWKMLSRSLFLYFCTMYLFYFVKNSLKSAKSSQLTGMEENIPQEMTKLDESGWQDSGLLNLWCSTGFLLRSNSSVLDILDDENDLDLLPLVTYAFNALNNLSIVDDNWYSGSKEPRLVHPENVRWIFDFWNIIFKFLTQFKGFRVLLAIFSYEPEDQGVILQN